MNIEHVKGCTVLSFTRSNNNCVKITRILHSFDKLTSITTRYAIINYYRFNNVLKIE